MRDDVDLRADDLAFLNERTPARIGQRSRVIGGEEVRTLDGVCLAVFVEFFKGCLVNGERGDPRLLRAGEHLLSRQPLACGEFQKPLVVDGEFHRTGLLLDGMTLHTNEEARDESDEDCRKQNRMIVKFLHV